MRYYAIADLHGRYDLLEKSLEKITEHALKHPSENGAKIITLGDYIDRGPESARVIQCLMDRQDDRFICLKGNHEDIMLQAIPDWTKRDWWYQNGGLATVQSYGAWIDETDSHYQWVKNLPLYHETEKHIFVHAGVDKRLPLEDQNEEQLMWRLYSKDDHGGWFGKHVVHGHHIHEDGPHEWEQRTALDTGSFYTDRQVIGVFDDTQGRALEFIEVRA